MNQLIRCINCDEITLKTPFDQWPEYEYVSNGLPESFRMVEKNDFQDFLRNHRGHQMEDLAILEDSFVSEKPYSEPMKISYIKVTNGKERFVVKKFRKKISEPLTYQLFHGDYSLRLLRLEIQSEEIIKQLRAEFKKTSLPTHQIEAFVKLYQQIQKTMDIRDLERVPEDSSHPLVIYYRMDDVSLAYLLRNCRNIFEGQEYFKIEEFIHRHRDDGVLLLKGTYQIQIAEMAKSKRETSPAQTAFKEKTFIEKK